VKVNGITAAPHRHVYKPFVLFAEETIKKACVAVAHKKQGKANSAYPCFLFN